MQMLSSSLLGPWLAGVLCISAFGLSGCGGDTTDVSSADDDDAIDGDASTSTDDDDDETPDGGDNAGGNNAGGDNAGGDPPDDDDSPDGGQAEPPSADTDGGAGDAPDASAPPPDPMEPMLPDVPRETVIDDLPEDDRIAVCRVYVQSAASVIESATGACGAIAVNSALRDQGAGDFASACQTSRSSCEENLASAGQTIDTLDCTMPTECAATIGEFEDCRAELDLLTDSILDPVGAIDIPACASISTIQATLLQLQIAGAFATGASASGLEFGAGGVQMSACEPLNEKCPNFAVPTDFNL